MSPEVGRSVEAVHVVRRGHVAGALSGLVPVADVPELAAPADEELGVGVVDPGGAAPHQRVGHGVAAQLVEVDHPDAVVALRSQVQLAAARTGACTEDSRGQHQTSRTLCFYIITDVVVIDYLENVFCLVLVSGGSSLVRI